MSTIDSTRAPFEGPPDWLRAPLAVRARPRLIVAGVAVGVVGDLAVRAGGATLAGALLVLATAAALATSGRVVNPQAGLSLGAAVVLGAFLAVRTSAWITVPTGLSAAALLVLGASLSRSGSLFELSVRNLCGRALHATMHVLCGVGLVRVRVQSSRVAAVVRGVLVAVPVVLLFGALLVSADAVFASILDLDLTAADATGHAAAVVAVAWVALGLLRITTAKEPIDPPAPPARMGRVEATIVLVSVVVLFGAFVVTQVVTAAGGADHVMATAGLTRAEYARSGFFQLLWVAGLTITGLALLAACADLDRRLPSLVAAVVALAVAIVGVALVRLDLYRDAYGWTMLRLSCTVFAGWLGVVLVLVGIALAGPPVARGRRGWVVPASIGSGLAVLVALDVVNPEAMVARYNLTHTATVAVDGEYLSHLSADAVPTIVAQLDGLDEATRLRVVVELGCPDDRGHHGWASWNASVTAAAKARRPQCTA